LPELLAVAGNEAAYVFTAKVGAEADDSGDDPDD